jgi:hypothetical protein
MSYPKQLLSLNWKFQRLDESVKVSDELLEQCLQICVDGFGFESDDWMKNNREKFATSTIFGKLLDAEGKLYGISFYSAPVVTLSGFHVLWEDGICLARAAQNQGYAQQVIGGATSFFPARQFKWVGCRTQNPTMMMRYANFGDQLFPFDELYDSEAGQTIMAFLLEHIAEVQTTHQCGKLNLINGICTQLYPQGRLGDYCVDLEKVAGFEAQLQAWEFQRERGDAVILVSSLLPKVQ